MALVGEQLCELQDAVRPVAEQGYSLVTQTQELSSLSGVLDCGTSALAQSLSELSATVQRSACDATGSDEGAATSKSWAGSGRMHATAKSDSLDDLRSAATTLHQQVREQRQLLLLLKEQESGAAERTRDAFDQLDSNGDGELQWEEFEAAAAVWLSAGRAQDPSYRQELRAQFESADADGSASLSYEEFVTLMASVRGDAIGPLRAALTDGLQQLVAVSLQMIALTLTAELTVPMDAVTSPRPGRAKELSGFVDRWCEIERRAAAAFDAREYAAVQPAKGQGLVAPRANDEGPADTADAGEALHSPTGLCVVEGAMPEGAASMPDEANADSKTKGASADGELDGDAACFESLLNEVGSLAGALSLPNATNVESAMSRLARESAFAFKSFRQAMGFCYRGLRILFRDVGEVFALVSQLWRGERMSAKDWSVVKRTVVDVVALVPYTIIMVIPMSPPGHVFAFSLLKKCFPAAVPSPFTAQRQDIYEIYTRIAAEADARPPPGISVPGRAKPSIPASTTTAVRQPSVASTFGKAVAVTTEGGDAASGGAGAGVSMRSGLGWRVAVAASTAKRAAQEPLSRAVTRARHLGSRLARRLRGGSVP